MCALHIDLLAILDTTRIQSSTRFTVAGVVRDLPGIAAGLEAATSERDRLVEALATVLYERLYIRPAEGPWPSSSDPIGRRNLIARLSAANTGTGTWEPGWTIHRIEEDGRVFVTKQDVSYWVSRSDLAPTDGKIRPGGTCRVRVPKERRNALPGFYLAIGDAEGVGQEVEPLGRFYWHLLTETAVPFMAIATRLLNESQVPYQIKVLSDPDAYRRADAGVLYFDRRDSSRIEPLIGRIHSEVEPGLRPDVPLLTKRLARGLGFAEDPPGTLSFGQHRCRLVANALWESFVRGESDRSRLAAAIADAFSQEGLDPLRPHLAPGSKDEWESRSLISVSVEPAVRTRGLSEPQFGEPEPPVPRVVSTLDASVLVARSLCRSAFWDAQGRLCNWIGRSSSERTEYGGTITPTTTALGPDYYGGSAGIALFLAYLSSVIADPEFMRTAMAAIRRSIRQLDQIRTTGGLSRLSFYLGPLGVALAARRIGAMTDHGELDTQARSILEGVLEWADRPHYLDVIAGVAGAIPALLALGRELGLERCRSLAIALGEELRSFAIDRDGLCAWPPDTASGPGIAASPLTGLSHGAAGIGLALFELYAETGRLDFLETASNAFAYEDSLFDARLRNWPDLRLSPLPDRSDAGPAFALAWCHGAPGIALTRLRAAELDPVRRDRHLTWARIAIATTLDAIDQQIEQPRADATLCHGLAGLIEIIWIAAPVLGDSSLRSKALAAARVLIDRHAASGDWPSGAPSGGPNPSLMLGTAGIGYTFLRLHDPERVPSVLLLTALP